MVEVRGCLYFSVIFLCFHVIAGKPIFDLLWCDFACDDDDVSTSTTTSTEDFYDWFSCDGCPRRQRRTTTPSPMAAGMQQQPFNLMIPPSNGMNVSLSNTGGSWLFNFIPWAAPATTTPGGAAGTATTPSVAAAGVTTPAPAATTAAAAATTVAAAAATTAAAAG